MTHDKLLAPIELKGDKLPMESYDSILELTSSIRPLSEAAVVAGRKLIETVTAGEIPEEMPLELTGGYKDPNALSVHSVAFALHSALNDLGYYTRITKKTARDFKKIVGEGTVLDPLAGMGWSAKALREAGVKTIASDSGAWEMSTSVEKLDAIESLHKYADNITHMLIGWPPMGETIDIELVEVARAYSHITTFVVGEENGCTGSANFYDKVEVLEWNPVHYRNVLGINDFVATVR